MLADGTFAVASTTFDSDEAATSALIDLGCSRIVALDRGTHASFFLNRAGTGTEPAATPPLVVRTVGDNGSVLVAGFNEGAERVVLTKHCENDKFTLPIKITVVSRNNKTARLVIERNGNISRFH